MEHIANEDMLALAKLCLRATKLRREIGDLEEATWRKRQRQAERFWASL